MCLSGVLFFHFGCPCSCYAAVCWVKREILQPEKANHELICLFSFYIFWRLKAQQARGELALQTACECCLHRWHEASWVALWQCGTVRRIGRHAVSMLECLGSWLGGVMEHTPRHALSFHWFSKLFSPVCQSSQASPGCPRSPHRDRMNETLVITTAWLH